MAIEITVTVPAGGTTAPWVDTYNQGVNQHVALCGVATPSTITSTAMDIQYSNDGTNALGLYDEDGTLQTVTIAASRYIYLDPVKYAAPPRYFRPVLGSTEADARVLKFYLREV